ncbi:MAG: hypothetical protein KJ058_07045 [Thermoanaerobaculia bacterium]|nr:hypothetical protein [Thermoanaerobaculia bacterium]MCZ7651237.1 hypothetical protein [Thermoanaerobaculia bacterium]
MSKLPIALLLSASIAVPVHAQYAAVEGDLVSEPAGVVAGSQPDHSAGDWEKRIILFPDEIDDKAGSPSFVFQLPGEFLVGSWSNMNWQYDMYFGGQHSFKKIVIDLDVVRGRWAGRVNDDPTNYGRDYYCVFWLNNGRSWDNMLGYLNFLYPGTQLESQVNWGGYWSPPRYGLKLVTSCPTNEGQQYHIQWVLDAENDYQYFKMTSGGQTICETAGGGNFPTVVTSYAPIQFGSQYSPVGPEGATIGWRFSNFKAQFLGDQPVGRRPRRR